MLPNMWMQCNSVNVSIGDTSGSQPGVNFIFQGGKFIEP